MTDSDELMRMRVARDSALAEGRYLTALVERYASAVKNALKVCADGIKDLEFVTEG
jgi:hypothetical protein